MLVVAEARNADSNCIGDLDQHLARLGFELSAIDLDRDGLIVCHFCLVRLLDADCMMRSKHRDAARVRRIDRYRCCDRRDGADHRQGCVIFGTDTHTMHRLCSM
jgi:hypothetical protein